jgi:hypothetical protein
MSSCCGNPYVGPESPEVPKPPEKREPAFKPSEVRLYGRKYLCPNIDEMKKKIWDDFSSEYAKAGDKPPDAEVLNKVSTFVADYIADVISEGTIVEEKRDRAGKGEAGRKMIKLKLGACYLLIDPGINVEIVSLGVIYGYSYEGHCYKLPKPQIMYLPVLPEDIIGGSCGCDCGYVPELGYVVWSIDKLQRVIALDIRSDDLKTLVLDENMPGNRSPLAYSQTLALAPQRSHE